MDIWNYSDTKRVLYLGDVLGGGGGIVDTNFGHILDPLMGVMIKLFVDYFIR